MNRIANIDHDKAPEHVREKIRAMIHRRVTATGENARLIGLIDEGKITKAIKHVALFSAYPPAVWDEVESFYEGELPVEPAPAPTEITVEDIRQKLGRLEKRERDQIVPSMPIKTARLHYAIANTYSALRAAIEANDLSILRED